MEADSEDTCGVWSHAPCELGDAGGLGGLASWR